MTSTPNAFDLAPAVPKTFDISGTTAVAAGTDLSLPQAVAAPVVAGVLALDLTQSDTFSVQLTADVTTVLFSGWPTGGRSKRVAIYVAQDSVGGHAVAWPSGVKWSSGIPHAVSPAPGAIDCFVFGSFDGGRTLFGNVVGLAYA